MTQHKWVVQGVRARLQEGGEGGALLLASRSTAETFL